MSDKTLKQWMQEREQRRRELKECTPVYASFKCSACRNLFDNAIYVLVLGEKLCNECLRDAISDTRPNYSLPGEGRLPRSDHQYHGKTGDIIEIGGDDSADPTHLPDEWSGDYD